ncbi:hypothetical protein [Streptomyces beijiangensis]|uniref:Secreted protein n=1 Tax=Streptomyces beijiangensis TaxID=163361 RepID=A0A939FFJ3_9ACTN|nr:hypothetical protein [Streptomyces beijiangensis]MBO0516150.1 hypothetical protein [Streptomyces beijiangensis]
MTRSKAVSAGLALVASSILVLGMGGSASASGLNVSVNQSWGVATFYPDGDWLYVTDKSADGYSVQAKIERWQKIASDTWDWRDHRTGCYDTTSIGQPGTGISTCNYDLTENDTVRVCIVRSKAGTHNGNWVCSSSTKA